jgi:hypothetical protein
MNPGACRSRYVDAVAAVDGEGKIRSKHSPEGARALTGLAGLTQGPRSSNADHPSGMTQPLTRMTRFVTPTSGSSWPAAAAAVWAPLVAKGKPYGSTWPATPYWWVNTSSTTDDGASSAPTTAASVLGHFDGTDLPSLVHVKHGDHSTVYSSNPGLPTEAYLALALAAGVHSYTPVVSSTTRVEAGGNMLVVHRAGATNTTTASGGGCQVQLPKAMAVRDAADGTLICASCAEFSDCRVGEETRVYLLG